MSFRNSLVAAAFSIHPFFNGFIMRHESVDRIKKEGFLANDCKNIRETIVGTDGYNSSSGLSWVAHVKGFSDLVLE